MFVKKKVKHIFPEEPGGTPSQCSADTESSLCFRVQLPGDPVGCVMPSSPELWVYVTNTLSLVSFVNCWSHSLTLRWESLLYQLNEEEVIRTASLNFLSAPTFKHFHFFLDFFQHGPF